jgi:23S rRNA pseudouridine2605 synthase
MSQRRSRTRVGGAGSTQLNRALSKLGLLSRTQATEAIRAGRVRVDGRVILDPLQRVAVDRARISIDEAPQPTVAWRTILFHKPRGVVTTRRDPQGRKTIYDALGDAGRHLIAIGRLDLATSGLLLLTSDTQLAHWMTDPANGVPRVYLATVRGRVTDADVERIREGVDSRGERLRAHAVTLRKASGRESHLTVELREGKNREVRRLFEAIGHEVTRLKRVALGGLDLGALGPGAWRELRRDEVSAAFPLAPVSAARPPTV